MRPWPTAPRSASCCDRRPRYRGAGSQARRFRHAKAVAIAARVLIAGFRQFACGAGRIGGNDRHQSQLPDHLPALAERMDVTVDRVAGPSSLAPAREELMMDAQEVLADDVEIGGRHQIMNVGDAAGDRIVDGDHGEHGFAILHRREGVLEGAAGERLMIGIGFQAGNMRVGPRLALIGDLCFIRKSSDCRRCGFSMRRAIARSAGYRRPRARNRRARRRSACRFQAPASVQACARPRVRSPAGTQSGSAPRA